VTGRVATKGLRTRRSPRQRFCWHACRRAVERVWERERRWHRGAPGSPQRRCDPHPWGREMVWTHCMALRA
jgi:hypothetical protein